MESECCALTGDGLSSTFVEPAGGAPAAYARAVRQRCDGVRSLLPASVVALCRRLARMSRFELTAAYVTCFVGATVLYDWGRASHPGVRTVGALLGLVAVSLLFTVVTWYRKDPIPGAAVLLAIATTSSYLIGGEITLLFLLPGQLGAAAVMGFGAAMGLPIAILE